MPKTVAIGHQDFSQIIQSNYFYIDKTDFIREWWENGDAVTLIARPRRFGKTLNMSMLEQFFSVEYAGRGDLFQGLSIWEETSEGKSPAGPYDYRQLQGSFPVISLSFAKVKENSFPSARKQICQIIAEAYSRYGFLADSGLLDERERESFRGVSPEM